MQSDYSIKDLELRANHLRQDLIRMLAQAGSGHSAGPLDLADAMSALFFHLLRHRPHEPLWPDRDRLIFSAGHTVPIRYVAMAHSGYFPKDKLKTLRLFGSPLQGHPSRDFLPAIETSTGPLGQGISVAVGMALAALMDRKKYYIYVVMSDGELNEGQSWEALMLAARLRLRNLIVLIDRNNIQIDGFTEDVMPLDPLIQKLKSFRWHVMSIDGHNIERIIEAVQLAKEIKDQPSMVILNTIPGKGVAFMENKYQWHGKPPTVDEAQQALRQLRTLEGKLDSTDIH